MADSKVTSNGNVTVWWVPAAGLTDYRAPTAAEINAGIDLTDAIAWDTFDLAAAESNDVEDRSLRDVGNATTRGFQQFSASFSMFRDLNPTDNTSPYVQAFETFRTPRQHGYLITRILQVPAGQSVEASPGEWISVYKFMSDAVGDDTEGEDSVKLTVEFLPQGEVAVYTIVGGADAIVATPDTLTLETGDIARVTATLDGKNVAGALTWTSSNYDVANVSANGVVRAVSDGTATITGSHRGAGGPAEVTVTVGA